ncbi:response regulator [Polynucleobacter sp. CS-Odin-A6]|uniref:response regulator n=1 Tax=Polynucleobacter sp. CS-Odin-A6 TaxID=2689106 RepID=UPI001C0DE156|nr:response regulator [Polynucleobacter sp. CS-Odin-A6]MBU3621481.1 response regulator [Polynucleobacter sp. CS-Odin-A6]
MNDATILIVDDTAVNLDLLQAVLESRNYKVRTASSGAEALAAMKESIPDLVVLDVMMPEMSGYEVCTAIRQDPATMSVPVVMLTALDPALEKIKGIEAGADDFLTKPLNQAELFARIESLLKIAHIRKELEKKVVQQTKEIEGLNHLKTYVSPTAAEISVSENQVNLHQAHRSEITIVFIELRGFSYLASDRQAEEVMVILSEVHQVLGKLISQFFGKVQRFSCDEVVIFFNDPIPVENPTLQAVSLAKRFNTAFINLKVRWAEKGYTESLSLGTGIATGYALLNMFKVLDREVYSAIGEVGDHAMNLSRGAKKGEILIDTRTAFKLNSDEKSERHNTVLLKDLNKYIEARSLQY